MLKPNEEILFTRQRHEAKKAGTHYDIRLVAGDKAYSWASRKEMPEPGKAIILYQQPDHSRSYALSDYIEIPDGQYGAGKTYLETAFKAKIGEHSTPEQLTLHLKDGKYLLKKLDEVKYGSKSWLFKNLSPEKPIEKVAEIHPDVLAKFKPDLTAAQMKSLGVLEGKYTKGNPKEDNFFKTDASMTAWPDKWHNDQHPLGWFEWKTNYDKGIRTSNDERQIKRWISFKARHLAQLQKADPTLQDLTIQPRRRQALLNWGIAPGISMTQNRYLEKIARSLNTFKTIVKPNAEVKEVRDLIGKNAKQYYDDHRDKKKKKSTKIH